MRNIQAFGTDDDTNVSEAFSHNFPFAVTSILIHFEHNSQEKLCDLGVPLKFPDEFVYDAMGNHQGSTYQTGLVDFMTISDFDQAVRAFARLDKIWNLRTVGIK